MTPTEQDLAQQLAQHPLWRWMAGMRACSPDGWARVDDERLDEWEGWPDLDDPATQGCLAAMLGSNLASLQQLCARYDGKRWRCVRWFGISQQEQYFTDTLGEALARALLALWGSTDA